MSFKIKKGDTVEVISGDDRGTRGRVLRVNVQRGLVVVEGVNRVYKHVRPSRRNPQGGRLQVERPIHISNVMLVNPSSNRPTRVRLSIDDSGEKTRVGADDGKRIGVVKRATS